MRVHTGTQENGLGEKRPCAWVETTRKLFVEGPDLVNGLGSKYFRNAPLEDDEAFDDRPDDLPTSLTQGQILKIYWDELLYRGSGTLWTWTEDVGERRLEHATKWLTELVVGAFPEMEGYFQ